MLKNKTRGSEDDLQNLLKTYEDKMTEIDAYTHNNPTLIDKHDYVENMKKTLWVSEYEWKCCPICVGLGLNLARFFLFGVEVEV